MAREGLMDDTGWHGCDFEPPCSNGFRCAKEDKYPCDFCEYEALTCADCMLDLTDACPRGAGRVVDSEPCDFFIRESEEEVEGWKQQ